jgi:hypothetical protein
VRHGEGLEVTFAFLNGDLDDRVAACRALQSSRLFDATGLDLVRLNQVGPYAKEKSSMRY